PACGLDYCFWLLDGRQQVLSRCSQGLFWTCPRCQFCSPAASYGLCSCCYNESLCPPPRPAKPPPPRPPKPPPPPPAASRTRRRAATRRGLPQLVVTCAGLVEVAEAAAELTAGGKIITVAGGGDTVAALNAAGVTGGSPMFRPPAAPSSNGWRESLCRG